MEFLIMHRPARSLLLLAVAFGLVGCSGAPTVKLLSITPKPDARVDQLTGAELDPECQPFDMATRKGVETHLTFDGPCGFLESGPARCVKRPDDIYVYISHDLPHGGRFIFTVNVEDYKGSGHYPNSNTKIGAEIYIEVSRNGQFYYWTVRHAAVTVDESVPSVSVDGATLPAQAGTPAHGSEKVVGVVACPSVTS